MKNFSLLVLTFLLFCVTSLFSQNEVWISSYNINNFTSGIAVQVDSAQNVYVLCGSGRISSIQQDYNLIKYDSDGNRKWVVTYNGNGKNEDNPSAFFVDTYGNCYVTGRSVNSQKEFEAVTIKYNSDGELIWIAKYAIQGYFCEPKAITMDSKNNIYVTGFKKDYNGSEYNSCFIVKYNSEGKMDWAADTAFAENDHEEPVSIKSGNNGDIYIAGWTGYFKFASLDYLVSKYSSNGQLQWCKTYNGEGNGNDQLTALEVDNNGNCYVTGYSRSISNSYDFTTQKYNAAGYLQWTSRYNNGKGPNYAIGLKLDKTGNIIVTGSSYAIGIDDFATVKYDVNGNQLWAAIYPGIGEPKCIALDDSDNIYISGNNYSTIKYNNIGELQWSVSNALSGQAESLAVSQSGSVFVTGTSKNIAGKEVTTVKYSSILDAGSK